MKAHNLSRVWLAALLAVVCIDVTAALADDATNQKVIDYYRRKNNVPPAVEATITSVTDSKIPGAKMATLKLTQGTQSQEVTVLMSPDGKYDVFGEIEDISADPFKAIAAKINPQD